MIKKSLIACWVVMLVIVFSCSKENNNAEYRVDNITDLDSRVYDTVSIKIRIVQTNGNREKLFLSLKDVPDGITYSFSASEGIPDFDTNLTFIITDKVRLGKYTPFIVVASQNTSNEFSINLLVTDTLTMTMTVYDATQWTTERSSGEYVPNALVKLYRTMAAAEKEEFFHSTLTDSNGMAKFYHLASGTYFFTVEKEALSNISSKKEVNGMMLGYAITGLDSRHGTLLYRDQNGDGKITDLDRVKADIVIFNDQELSEIARKNIWIGN